MRTKHWPPPGGGQHYDLQFKNVSAARTEKTLVGLMLRRHRKREKGDYVTEQYLSEGGEIAQSFPANAYRNVSVCERCFKVYSLIEKARAKSLRKLEDKSDERIYGAGASSAS